MTFIKRKGRATLSVGKRGPRMSYRLGCAVPILAMLLVAALLAGCGTDAASTAEGTDWVATYGGSAEVYAGIASETDCALLQETFDRAADNNEAAEAGTDEHRWTLGYMTAADERMREAGCY